jgi:DNA-directed RNA polymerase specialized sigma24 family protein
VISQFVDIGSLDIPVNPIGRYEARRQLDYAMEALSADDHILIIMAELEGWTISEIAGMSRKSEGYVKMRLFRAREKMRRRLQARYRKVPETAMLMEGQENYELPPGSTESK